MLNRQKGNMYGFVTHTWNTVKGMCPHGCSYCYMKRWGPQSKLRFDENELAADLGRDNFIFVGSSCDMWAEKIPLGWIAKTLNHCSKFPENKYLFQSKNPSNMLDCPYPENSLIGTTIETNRAYPEMGEAPPIGERVRALKQIKEKEFQTMITIEPIMDFDFAELTNWLFEARPHWVNIGADSQGHGLPEPGPGKIKALIEMLNRFTNVKLKRNLERLLKK